MLLMELQVIPGKLYITPIDIDRGLHFSRGIYKNIVYREVVYYFASTRVIRLLRDIDDAGHKPYQPST